MSLRVFTADQVHAALPWAALAAALEAAFVDGATSVPLRHAHALGDGDSLLLMPAWSREAIGVKLVTVKPGAAAIGAATVQASYLLSERRSGRALALIDGEALTLRRTAAASALAARHLARDDAQRLLVVGAGRLAPWLARAHCALRPALNSVQIWARRAAAAETAAQALRDEGLFATAVAELEPAVRTADIVSCATTSSEPIVEGAWLAPGCHLDLVGSFRAAMREVDDAAVARCERIVVDTREGALAEAGDLVQALARGVIGPERIVDLAALLRGDGAGRRSRDEVTMFKSVGTALEDLAAAQLVLRGA